jgi:hypothetical protein
LALQSQNARITHDDAIRKEILEVHAQSAEKFRPLPLPCFYQYMDPRLVLFVR